jgi:hypothetical protein
MAAAKWRRIHRFWSNSTNCSEITPAARVPLGCAGCHQHACRVYCSRTTTPFERVAGQTLQQRVASTQCGSHRIWTVGPSAQRQAAIDISWPRRIWNSALWHPRCDTCAWQGCRLARDHCCGRQHKPSKGDENEDVVLLMANASPVPFDIATL